MKYNAEEITSYYLYGQEIPPSGSEFLDEKWTNRDLLVDISFTNSEFHDYMTNGPGRFANASQMSLVENFFSFDIPSDLLGKEVKFSLNEAVSKFGGSYQHILSQVDFEDEGGE